MRKEDFSKRLADDRVVVCDGAMGTLLYSQGVSVRISVSGLNLGRPQLIIDIHKSYVAAGAEIVETNTFDANYIKLSQYSLEDRLYEINSKAVQLAKEAVGIKAYVAGSIGPLGKPLAPIGRIDEHDAQQMYREQISALSESGADLLILETFPDLNELLLAIGVAKRSTDIPIFGQLTFIEEDSTPAGQTPVQCAIALDGAGCDVIGANCGGGPSLALDIIKEMKKGTSLPLSSFPNASSPRYKDGVFSYESEASYFANIAERIFDEGVKFIGGCCGTTPVHISAVSKKLQDRRIHRIAAKTVTAQQDMQVKLVRRASSFSQKLAKKFVVTVEVAPPRSVDYQKSIKWVGTLKELGVDAINVADNPLARARMSSIIFAHLMRERVGIDTILHFTCRDRNLLGLQSDLLGASALGIDNLLVVRGDPAQTGDYAWATNVFDVTTLGLVRITKRMNSGRDLADNPIGKPTDFFVGVAANPNADHLDDEIKSLEEKASSGADFIITQPVYQTATIKRFIDATGNLKTPILCGILPPVNKRQIEFLHNEVAGMAIPENVRNKILAMTDQEAVKAGIDMSIQLINDLRTLVSGVYIVPPAKNLSAVKAILQSLGKRSG